MDLYQTLTNVVAVGVLAWIAYILGLIIYQLYLSPLARFPGPKLAAVTSWYDFYYDAICHGKYTFEIARMHQQYGIKSIPLHDSKMLMRPSRPNCPHHSLGASHR